MLDGCRYAFRHATGTRPDTENIHPLQRETYKTGMSPQTKRHEERAAQRGWALLEVLVARLALMLGAAGPLSSRPVHTAILRLLRPAEALARRLLLLKAANSKGFRLAPSTSPFPATTKQWRKIRAGGKAPRLRLLEPIRVRFADHDAPATIVPSICRRPSPARQRNGDAMPVCGLKRRLDGLKHAIEKPEHYVCSIHKWMISKRRKGRLLPVRTSRLPTGVARGLDSGDRECLEDIHHFARQADWPPWPPGYPCAASGASS